MAKKMYYSEEEAAAVLGIDAARLVALVKEGKLRQFKDGSHVVYRVEEIDNLSSSKELKEEEIELAPSDTFSGSQYGLTQTNAPIGGGKDDTVITAEGISIFDEEDLEIEDADPMAKTQMAMSLEEQVGIEGAGTGSGLLDLTRESDDTSLGAVLDRIEESSGPPSAQTMGVESLGVQVAAPAAPMIVEQPEPLAALFAGLLGGAAVVAMVMGMVIVAAANNVVPSYLEFMGENTLIAWLIMLAIVGIGMVVGLFAGKSARPG